MPTSLSATRPDAKAQAWPALPLDKWRDTYHRGALERSPTAFSSKGV
jgi:hypothetical protein